jgi:hypothetical protein
MSGLLKYFYRESLNMEKIKGILRDEKGTALVLVCLAFVLLLGFSALVIDYGALALERRKMVTAADAGALAGARILLEASGNSSAISAAEQAARETAIANGAQPDLVNVNVNDHYVYKGKEIQVIIVNTGHHKDFIFSRVLNLSSHHMDVKARAVGTWGYVTRADEDFLPLFIEASQFGDGTQAIPLHMKNEINANWGIFGFKKPYNPDDVKNAIRGDLGVIDPPIKAITEWSSWPEDYIYGQPLSLELIQEIKTDADKFIYGTETGAMQVVVDALDRDSQHLNQQGRLYRNYQHWLYQNGQIEEEVPDVSLEGVIPIVEVIDTATAGQLDSIVVGFAKYKIEDVITDPHGHGSNYSTANGGTGSDYQENQNRGTYRFHYPQYDRPEDDFKGTVIGRVLGEAESGYTPGKTVNIVQNGIGLKYSFLLK